MESQLTLGASTVPGQCLIPELMTEFLSRYPESSYIQLRGDSMQIHRYLDQGKCRIGFVGTAANRQTYKYPVVAEGVREEQRLVEERTPCLSENVWNREKPTDWAEFSGRMAQVAELYESFRANK